MANDPLTSSRSSTPQPDAMARSSGSTLSSLDKFTNLAVPNTRFSKVPIDALLGTLFPFIAPKLVEEVERSLLTTERLSERGWTAFEATCTGDPGGKQDGIYEPSNSKVSKSDTFKALELVFSDILESAAQNTKPLVCFSMHGNRIIPNDIPNTARPDGFIYLTMTTLPWPRKEDAFCPVLDYADIGFIIEARKHSTPENRKYNERKILYGAQCKMRCDPHCRFVTGITLENTTTRLWYFDRGGILCSEPFDFMKDPQVFIHIFLGFILAEDREEIGFDNSIQCIARAPSVGAKQKGTTSPGRQYQIDVQSPSSSKPTSFHTTRCVDDRGAEGIYGRGTRVWEVTMVGDPEKDRKYVLKDVWIDEDRADEGTVLKKIHRALIDAGRTDEVPQPVDTALGGALAELRHFLTPKYHGSVLMADLDEDKTIKLSVPVSSPVPIQPSPGTGSSMSASSSRDIYDTYNNGPPRPPFKWGRRKHIRVVFEEPPGRSINKIKTYPEAFETLHGGLKAMQLMFRHGFIHRDVSPGNILLMDYGDSRTGVLIDFEYANEFPDKQGSHHAVRTGTKQFMAVEVVSLKYLFKPRPNAKTIRDPGEFPWSHNPLHDLESAWWIAIWIAFTFPGTDLSEIETNLRDELFSEANQTTRQDFFMLTNVLFGLPGALPDSLRFHLELWRQQLCEAYNEAEKDLQDVSHLTFDYDKSFAYAIDIVDKIRTTLVELPHDDGIAAPTSESG